MDPELAGVLPWRMVETIPNRTAVTDKVKILVVDDSQADLNAFEAILDGSDRIVLKAGSGAEALRILLQEEVAVILLDIKMPEMDGYETARLIRAREKTREVPIIFMTAHHRDELDIQKGYGLGAVDFLFRPVPSSIVKAKVNCFVALAKQRLLYGHEAGYGRRSSDVQSMPRHGRLLIVDDDPALLQALPVSLQLRIPSLQIDLCESSKEALERLKLFSYGTIIADFKMPEIDGFSFIREARTLQPLAPVLLLSGCVEYGMEERALSAGAYAFLEKPKLGEDVAAVVKRSLETYALRRYRADLEPLIAALVTQTTEMTSLGMMVAEEMNQGAMSAPDGSPLEKVKHLMEQLVAVMQSEAQIIRQITEAGRSC